MKFVFLESWVDRSGSCNYFAYLRLVGILPVRGRLIGGVAGLLSGLEIVGELNNTVGFGKRDFHIGQCEWRWANYNRNNRWVFPPPTVRV